MPELPEVETMRRALESTVRGQSIEHVSVLHPQVIAHPGRGAFCRAVCGQKIAAVRRRGKFLRIVLENESALWLHLRMTGFLVLAEKSEPQEKHTHLVFTLSDGKELRYFDPRRFGRFWLVEKGENFDCGVGKLGLEPGDPALTADYLKIHFRNSQKAIKTCLLEQSAVCGIGNIYADEILFCCRIPPQKKAASLQDADWQRLAEEIPKQLAYFTEKNRTAPEAFFRSKGDDYRNTPYLRVYGREKEPCLCCGTPLEKTEIAGRSSVFCPHCQQE